MFSIHRCCSYITLFTSIVHYFQLVVEKLLASEGIKRVELGRDEFTKRVWEWKKKYIILLLSLVPLCNLFPISL